MTIEQLKKLCEKNEAAIFDWGGRKRTPPYYYDSLRHALGFYFKTFHTQNHLYHFYAMDFSRASGLKSQYLDQDNTVQTIVAFERFFELFIKDVLGRTYKKLTYWSKNRLKGNKAAAFIKQIREGSYEPRMDGKKYLSVPFREAIELFYGLVALTKTGERDPIITKFRRILKPLNFMDSKDVQSTLFLLSWYRDRILHKGDRLPSLLMLDYIVSQRIIPLVKNVTESESGKLGKSLFYFTTVTDINILGKISELKFEFSDFTKLSAANQIAYKLLYLGHLKELGRANLNMNVYVRGNFQATYEYNYKDPKGRARRFAEAEKQSPQFKDIKKCPCCGEKTLVVYRQTIDDFFNPGKTEDIDWVKCYLCDYHIRYSVGNPQFFKLHDETLFS